MDYGGVMNVIVCVKQVAHIYIQSGFDPSTKDIVTDGLVYRVNPYDETAVEEAIRIKEKSGKGEVTVITIGPPRAEETLRWCLAMGADNAVHIVKDGAEKQDPWMTASILADRIKEMEYDLLLFGKKAIDDEMGQVGIFVAELLGLPAVSAVAKLELTDVNKALIQRSLEKGNREEVDCPIPAVFTVEKTLNRPRYPTFPARKAARTKPIQQLRVTRMDESLSDPQMNIVHLAPPKLRPKKILSPDSNLSAAARINFVMTGGMGQKKSGVVGGDPKQLVTGIIDFLKEKKVIGT